MKKIIINNSFVFGLISLVIGLLGYQEFKSFVFGLFFLIIALILFVVSFLYDNK